MDTVLECRNVTKTYDGKQFVLKGVSMKVYDGDFVSILGESGSGKSTLIGILGGMDTPTAGSVLYDGVDISSFKEKDLAILRRTKVGFVFQFFNLAPYLTAKENILLPIILDGKSPKAYEAKLQELVATLKIGDVLDKMPSQLSGGEQQRVAIARGLIYQPRVILLDEPTGNLDAGNSEEIMTLLKAINDTYGTTVIQVTHSESNALYGNKIVRIRDGEITEEILARPQEEEREEESETHAEEDTPERVENVAESIGETGDHPDDTEGK